MASKDITFMSGEKSNFKFNIGDVVIPAIAKAYGSAVEPSKVTALQLDGYIQIEPIGAPTCRRQLVEAKHYERFEEEAGKPTN